MVGVALYPTLRCVDLLQKELANSATEDSAILYLQKQSVQGESFTKSKMKLVLPICREREPLSNAAPWLALAGILMLAGFFPLLGRTKMEEKDTYEPPSPMRLAKVVSEKKGPVRAPIHVDGGFEISQEEESEAEKETDAQTLMSYVEGTQPKKRGNSSVHQGVRIHSAIGSESHEGRTVFFVDPTIKEETNTRFSALDRALFEAQKKILEGAQSDAEVNPGVQIQIEPGIYQLSIEIPPNVVLVNHKMPKFKTLKNGLIWVSKQELEDPNRVTILADPRKNYAVKFSRGTGQGIFGCHIIGRGDSQSGIIIDHADSVEIVNCVIEQFAKTGILIQNSGTQLPNINIAIRGSMVRFNTGEKGGGIFAKMSAFTIESSVIRENIAFQGGGLFIEGSKHLIELTELRFEKNVAKAETKVKANMEHLFGAWKTQQGVGGAIFVVNAKLKIYDLECIDNTAFLIGGGIANLGSKVVVQNTRYTSRIERNRSQVGGGIFVSGDQESPAILKLEKIKIQNNQSKIFGAGIGISGAARVQVHDSIVSKNESNISGGAFSCHLGGSLDVIGGRISQNISRKNGGAIVSINGRIRLRDRVELRENMTEGSGGCLFAISEDTPSSIELIKRQEMAIPLRIILEDVVIRKNRSGKIGPALRLGNISSVSTVPLKIEIDGKTSIRSNTTHHASSQEIFVTWAGQTLSNDIHEYKDKSLGI